MLQVRPSRIKGAGRGLFTTSRIRKGDIIVEYLGDKLTWQQCLNRYKKDLSQLLYVFAISNSNCIDAKPCPDELAQYANDANGTVVGKRHHNNCEYSIIKGRPYIVATKAIGPGAEILVDYGDEYWEAVRENSETENEKKGKSGKTKTTKSKKKDKTVKKKKTKVGKKK